MRPFIISKLLFLLVGALPLFAEDGAEFLQQVKQATAWLSGFETRLPGSESHDRAVRGLEQRIRALPGVRFWRQSFPVVVPHTRMARLSIGPQSFRIYPLWPASVRLNTTPAPGISGKLIYVGKAELEDLPSRSLRGNVAVMEMSGAGNWTRLANLGARAILLLGSENDTCLDTHAHLVPIPINVPRFYLPVKNLSARIMQVLRRNENPSRATVTCRAEWKEVTATNLVALVKPARGHVPRRAFGIMATMDTASTVPESAPGADAAVDAAVALNALRYFSAHPPARPLLFIFLDAYGLNQLGLRHLLAALSALPEDKKKYLLEERRLNSQYLTAAELARTVGRDPQALGSLSQDKFRPLHRFIKDEVAREVVSLETVMHPKRLALHRAGKSGAGEKREELDRLRAEIEALSAQRMKFFAAQMQLLATRSDGSDRGKLAAQLWDRARQRIEKQLEESNTLLASYRKEDEFRLEVLSALGLEEEIEKPLEFLLGLDLSDAGVVAGPATYCRYLGIQESQSSSDFRRWLADVQEKEGKGLWPEWVRKAIDLSPLTGLDSPDSYTGGNQGTLTSAARSFGTAAITWATLDALRLRVDTPNDRFDGLDWSRLSPQVEATRLLLKRIAEQTDFIQTSRVVPRWSDLTGVVVDQSPGEPVPRLPMPEYLTVLVPGWSQGGKGGIRDLPAVAGIRRQEFTFTRTDGRFHFRGVLGHVSWYTRAYFVQSYLLDKEGRIQRAVNMRKQEKGVNLNVNVLSRAPRPLRALVFSCRSMQGFDFFDPRFLLPLPSATVLDAIRGTEPQRMNFTMWRGMMCCQLEPDIRWELILRAGVTRNRMALLNVKAPGDELISTREAIQGFRVGEPLETHPIVQSARDFYRLDEIRLADYAQAGISSKAISELRATSKVLLDSAAAAEVNDDGRALLKGASGALANEVRAYQAVRDTANDVIRGAIFLLLALAPFSYAVERLLFATPRVYRQILGIFAIFTFMTAILWSFHPAFRISSQPLMILMAFGIILMSLLVISVIYSRFETELEEFRSGRAESSGARTSRGGLLVTALKLGIANMRKRKFRTVLTGSTIVLITFALLCFTSASSYSGQKEFALAAKPPYTGVLVRQPNSRPMPFESIDSVQNVVGEEHPVSARFWWANPWNQQWRVHVRNASTGARVSLQAGLVVSAHEGELTGMAKLCPRWEEFSNGNGCYLAAETAEQLGASPGDRILIAGQSLELLGIFEAQAFNRQVRDLDGASVLPFDYNALGDQERRTMQRVRVDELAIEIQSGAGMEPDLDIPHLSSATTIILHPRRFNRVSEVGLRSLAIGASDATEARALALELSRRLAFPIYFSSPEQTRVMATTPLLPRARKSILIPLVIAGLIIFNTMLSSLAERKKEIYIYTSLGLAPLHVGFLFLAEAITYGLLGSIFGYVVGQGVATVFTKFGWMGSLTLNYSGTQAIMTMLMVLSIVVLSSLIPAFMAGRMAVPANEMRWKVPDPDGDTIVDTLPFTVTGQTANGVVAFLLEYMDAHREGSIGNFSTDHIRPVPQRQNGLDLVGIEGTVWLAPYDLGVRQQVEMSVCPADEENLYEITVRLVREAGQLSTWKKLNRVFLGDLRRQLLGWRNLKLERMMQYIAEARGLLDIEIP